LAPFFVLEAITSSEESPWIEVVLDSDIMIVVSIGFLSVEVIVANVPIPAI
jgi:hypothetical protein